MKLKREARDGMTALKTVVSVFVGIHVLLWIVDRTLLYEPLPSATVKVTRAFIDVDPAARSIWEQSPSLDLEAGIHKEMGQLQWNR